MAWDGQSLEDPFGGASDLQERLIRCVGEADARFSEDALRNPARAALRFCSWFSVEKGTRTALSVTPRHSGRLAGTHGRGAHRPSLRKKRPLCAAGVRCRSGAVLPEILPLVGFGQHNPHHIYDAWEHTAAAVAAAPAEPRSALPRSCTTLQARRLLAG
jgi:tRNA nucleotidyltransferase (CCA-adding enzyme)